MRTQQEIEQEIEQVDAVLATFEAEPGEDSPVALRHTYRKNTDLLATLKAELSTAVAGQLRWKIENDVVHGHAIELGHLSGLLHEFDRSTRYFGADIARVEDPQLGAPVEDVVSPMLVGTFEGSFGLILKPRGSGEQMQLLSPPLFERTLARILDVLTAIAEADEDLTDVLLEKLAGMGSRSVGAVRDLSRIMSEAGGSSVLVWSPVRKRVGRVVPTSQRPKPDKSIKPSVE